MTTARETANLAGILKSRAACHAYSWLALFALLALATSSKEAFPSLGARLAGAVDGVGLVLPPVYLHFLALEKLFYRRRYGLYALSLSTIVAGCAFIYLPFSTAVFRSMRDLPTNIAFITLFIVVSTALHVLWESVRQRLQIQEIRSKQVQTELGLLKAQINPHFLFNTLNNLFSLARKADPAAADGIARLSHLMRYMIYDSASEKVELAKEVDQIKRLIELEKLRFSPNDEIDIRLGIQGDTHAFRLPPMLLIPLVENAFKHGVRISSRSFIHMDLKVAQGKFEFTLRNSLHPPAHRPGPGETGVGLQNVRRRLELLYPRSHRLAIQETEGEYRIDLSLDNGGEDKR